MSEWTGASVANAPGPPWFHCIVCGAWEAARPFPNELPWLAKCPACGLAAVHPQPSDAELAQVYDEDYYRTFGYDEKLASAYRAIKQRTAEWFLKSAEGVFRGGRLLDVGSGLGDMLAVAGRRGWNASGVEPNRAACEASDRVVPGAVFRATFEQYEGRPESFDLITCTEVLEHLRRPDAALSCMHRLLRPGGGLLLTVPDAGSLMARLRGPRWVHYHRDHLWYFDRRTLAALTDQAGFDTLVCRGARKVFNLRYVLGVFASSPHPLRANNG